MSARLIEEALIEARQPLVGIRQTALAPTLVALSQADATVGDADWLRKGSNAALLIRLARAAQECEVTRVDLNWVAGNLPVVLKLVRSEQGCNPFEQTVQEQIAALRKQNELGNWGIAEDVFTRLLETAPSWPKGKDAYRSFRIRFGEGDEGVALTFERHASAMKRVHAKYWRWELLHSKPMPYEGEDLERLRLLAGNATHHAVVEWVVINDLSANRKRESITDVCDSKSLADEGFVLAWLNPKRVQAIDYKEWCAFFLGGYEANVPENDDESWQRVVIVSRDLQTGTVSLSANWRSNAGSNYSVPSVEECVA